MKTQEGCNFNEEIFQQLTEDVSYYLWALSEWFNPTEDHSDTYLFLEIFERRSRAKKIISQLNNIPQDNKDHVNKLNTMLSKEEEHYKEFLQSKRIQEVIKNSIPEILNYLQSTLRDIIRTYEESLVYREENTFEEELYSLERDFLRNFTKIHYVKENAQDIKVPTGVVSSEFGAIEANFKKRFYCFEPIADFLSHQKDSFLPTEKEWWFTTEPDCYRKYLFAYLEDELEIDKKLGMERHLSECNECKAELEKIAKFGEMTEKISLLYTQQASEENCPSSEILSTYAINKSALSSAMRNFIDEHVSTCSHCLEDVITLRAAVALPRKIKFSKIPLAAKTRYKIRRLLGKVKSFAQFPKLSDLLSECFVNNRVITVSPASMSMAPRGEEEIDAIYHMKVSVDVNNQITLLPCPDASGLSENELKLCRAFERGEFYYKIFTFYKENEEEKIKEIYSGESEYLPFKIDRPNTNFFLVCLSKDQDILNGKTRNLLNSINNESEEKIDDIICLFVEIG